MAGFVSGLIHAGAVGLGGWDEGKALQQRKMLGLAAQRRQQQKEAEEAEIKRIEALARAREAGLNVTPQGGERSGDTPPTTNPVGPSITPRAGPTEKAPATRIGSIAGMDITMPEKYEPKSVRDKRAAIDAGVEKKPQQTLAERISELRSQGMTIEQAMKQARQEHGHLDPTETHRTNRQTDVRNPLPDRSDRSGGASPERRAQYVLRRASQLTQPKKVGYRVQPGLDRAAAEAQAGEEYDRVHGVNQDAREAGPTQPPAASPVTKPTAGGGGPVEQGKIPSAAQQARAAVDPAYRAFLISKKYKVK